MRRLRNLFAGACVALPILTTAAKVLAASDIAYVYPDQSVWTTETDDLGYPANPLLHLAKAIFSEAGLTWQAQPLPAARMFSSLKSGAANF